MSGRNFGLGLHTQLPFGAPCLAQSGWETEESRHGSRGQSLLEGARSLTVAPRLQAEGLRPREDRGCKEAMAVKCDPGGGSQSNATAVLARSGDQDTDRHREPTPRRERPLRNQPCPHLDPTP